MSDGPNYDPQPRRSMPPDEELSSAQMESDDSDVGAAVRGLAGLVADVDNLDAQLAHIAEFAMTAVPGTDGAGVTIVDGRAAELEVLAWSVTGPFVREIDHLQYDLCKEGPCLTAMQTGRTLVSGSLGSDARWPRFGGRVARLQVHSALSMPLISRGRVVGALNIYARERDAFTEYAVRLAEQFAAPAAVSVGNMQTLYFAHDRTKNLQAALVNRAVIDQAIGIIRSRTGASTEEAFDRLRRISQHDNVKLAEVARHLVDDSVKRARRAPRGPTGDR